MVRGGQPQGTKNAWARIFLPRQTEEAGKRRGKKSFALAGNAWAKDFSPLHLVGMAWARIFLPRQTEEAFKKDNAAKERWLEAGKRAMIASCAVFADLFVS